MIVLQESHVELLFIVIMIMIPYLLFQADYMPNNFNCQQNFTHIFFDLMFISHDVLLF